tara:strand:- start:2334 stop:2978 length:645 start_codon:yes stop_codon:yes gene_type:complete
MSEQKYELAFYGKLVDGASLEHTKEQVAQLFKTSVELIERMFTGSRVVIRNKLDQETAMKYIVALKKRGALSQIEEMGKPGIAVNFESDTASIAAPLSESSDVQAQPIPESAKQTQEPVQAPAQTLQKTTGKASMSATGLPIVGDKVDEILRSTQFDLAPVGARLENKKQDLAPDLHALDDVSLAPVGSDLIDHKEELPIAVPDTSHIQLAPKE